MTKRRTGLLPAASPLRPPTGQNPAHPGRVVVIGIRQSLRAELVDALGRRDSATRIEELGSAQELLDAGHTDFPDAALIIDCPDDEAVMAAEIQQIRRARPYSTIVALHRADEADHACVAIQAGANGCLSRGVDPAEIAEALHLLMPRPAPSRSHGAQGHGHQRLLVDLDTLATASLFDRLPVASYVIQGSGFAAVNHAAGELFHYSIGDMTRLRYWDVIAPAWRDDMRRRVRHWLRGEPLVTHGETPIVTGNGEHRWVEAHRRKIEFRGAPALLVVLNDITERRFWTECRHIAAQPKAASAAAPDRPASAAGPAAEHAEPYAWLTQRQAEVLGLIGQGRTNKQIARMLGITEGTVKLHVHALMRAFRVQNRTMLALVVL